MDTPDHRPRVAAERRERMRARLLDAAFDLAATGGPEAVTIDAVIARAGVARGSFYKYFDAPATLLQALAVEVSDAMIRAMHPFMEQLADPAERMASGVRTVLRLVRQSPRMGAFLARSGWPAVQRSHSLFTLVGVDIAAGMASGRLRAMHIDLALSALTGTVLGAMHAITSHDTPADLPEQAAAAILRALGLPADEAEDLATRPLALPTLATDPLVARWLAAV